MKRVLVYMLAGMALVGTSCSDFLDTIPHDALSPSTTWQTEKDAEKFLIGCYDGWADETGILYWDCASDFGFNFHVHENYRNIGNGSMTASNAVADKYKIDEKDHDRKQPLHDRSRNTDGINSTNQSPLRTNVFPVPANLLIPAVMEHIRR